MQGLALYKGQKLLKKYIKYCPSCNTNIEQKYKLYSNLQPINTVPVLFNTLTIDFIIALPLNIYNTNGIPRAEYKDKPGLNKLLIIIDKFIKYISLLLDYSMFDAETWGTLTIKYL